MAEETTTSTIRMPNPIRIVVFEKAGVPRQFTIWDTVKIAYGRPEGVNDGILYLDFSFLDSSQGMLTCREDGSWTYRDLSPENDSYLNAENIDDGHEVELQNNDVVRIEDSRGYVLNFVFLLDYKADTEWKVIPLNKKENVIHFYTNQLKNKADAAAKADSAANGDAESADAPEKKEKEKEAVHQALLKSVNKQWFVEDLNSQKGVYVNKAKVDGVRSLQLFDVVNIGDTLFLCQKEQIAYNQKTFKKNHLAIHIEERSVWNMLKKKTLLEDIDMVIEPGNLVLILGGSGAGKTTFINAITGYEKAKAKISDGDVDVYKNYDQIKYEIGFVPQQDLLRGEDTVIDTLENAAEMRMPAGTSIRERTDRVREVMNIFGLSAVSNSLVQKLSGGQRKRLSIGVEFMADPSLFILDEPDSGLDGVMARELVEQLRKIADQGKIVMVITHTPDRVIDLFDKVIVLAKDSKKVGRLAFYGSIDDSKEFFGTETMEGIVRAINGKDEGGQGRADEFVEKYKNWHGEKTTRDRERNQVNSEIEEDDETYIDIEKDLSEHTGRAGQIKIYIGKLMRLFRTQGDWKVLPMAVIISFMIAAVVGMRIFGDMDGTRLGSFAVVCVCIWNGFFNSIQVVCRERAIIKREHRAGLHITSYMAAHMIYQAFLCLAQVIIFMFCFKVMGINMPSKGAITGSFYVDFCITLFLITYAADMLALMVSCIVSNTTTAMTVMPFLLIIQLLFSGMAFPLEGPIEKASYITLSRWGAHAICSESDYNSQPCTVIYSAIYQFKEIDGFREAVQFINDNDLRMNIDMWNSQQMQVKDYEFSKKNVGKQWGILAAYAAIYALIGTLVLERIDHDKR